MLHDIGLGSLQREWQADPDCAMKTVYLVQVWQWNGMAVVLYLAGLQNVPEDIRHAALIDGANRWRVFRTSPFRCSPAFTIVTVLSFILIFRAFDLDLRLGGRAWRARWAHARARRPDLWRCLRHQRLQFMTRLSYAIAEGVTLFVFLAGVSGLLIKALGRREEAIQLSQALETIDEADCGDLLRSRRIGRNRSDESSRARSAVRSAPGTPSCCSSARSC